MHLCECNCKYLLAVDPGLMTGICMIDISDPQNPVKVWSAEVTVSEFYDRIAEFISHPETHLVYEKFTITDKTGELSEQPDALQLTGVMQYLCYLNGKTWDFQLPSEKPFADNDKLRAVDFWHVGGAGHANDSLRHAMIWIVNRNRKWTKSCLL